MGNCGNGCVGPDRQPLRRRRRPYGRRRQRPDPTSAVRTIETGSPDRRANMDAFAIAALQLLDEALGGGQ